MVMKDFTLDSPGGAAVARAACARAVWPALPAAPRLTRPCLTPTAMSATRRTGRDDAIAVYTRAAEGAAAGSPALLAAVNNRAAARLGASDAEGAAVDASGVLNAEPRNVKALLRRGAAHEGLGDVVSEATDYVAALTVDPGCDQARSAAGRLLRR